MGQIHLLRCVKIFILIPTFSTFVPMNMIHVKLYPTDWVWCSFRPQPRLGPTGPECHATPLQICEYCFQSTIVRYTPVRHARSAPTTSTRHERRHHIHARPPLTSPTITPIGSVTSTAMGAFYQQIDTRPVEHKNQLPPLCCPSPSTLTLRRACEAPLYRILSALGEWDHLHSRRFTLWG